MEYHEAFWLACVTVGPVVLLAHALSVSRFFTVLGNGGAAANAVRDRFRSVVADGESDADRLTSALADVNTDLRVLKWVGRTLLATSIAAVLAMGAAASATIGGIQALASRNDSPGLSLLQVLLAASVLAVVGLSLAEVVLRTLTSRAKVRIDGPLGL